jgi:ComF family protein
MWKPSKNYMIANIFDRSALAAKRMVRQLPGTALDLLFPLNCLGCQKEGRVLCASCIEALPELNPPYCAVCAQPNAPETCHLCLESPPAFDGVRAPYQMEGTIKEAVHSLKYRGLKAAAPELAELLAQYLAENPMPGDLLVPVPLHPRRLRSRGYNQSALLAKTLSKKLGLEMNQRLLTRTRNTPPQVNASRDDRRDNVQGSFRCDGPVDNRAVILVDDVATTGSTLSACAAVLKAAGAASVWGLVLARES